MADPSQKHRETAPGAWFADVTCIDCDACRQIAPDVFFAVRGATAVRKQPAPGDADALARAARALLTCPVGAIGVVGEKPRFAGVLPEPIGDVGAVPRMWACGYNARHSYGAHAYLCETRAGLVMIDGPRFVRALTDFIDARGAGGALRAILLTHQDDLGDAERYARKYGARVFVHAGDAAAVPFATDVFDGDEPREILDGAVTAIPVPGHTRGSALFLVDAHSADAPRERAGLLFTGDSLAWSREQRKLTAFQSACWYSWPAQTASLARVAESAVEFSWVLPGHGQRHRASAAENRVMLASLVDRMRAHAVPDTW